MNSKKKVLLASPASFKLYELIVENLEFLGYDVVHIEDSGYSFRYRSLFQRLYNLYRKTIFKDRQFKIDLRENYISYVQSEILRKHSLFDFALVIRADFFSDEILATIAGKTDLMLSFHYDGVSRDLKVLDKVHFFERFYVFDRFDVEQFSEHNFLYSPNFYFDYPVVKALRKNINSLDVYYVSSFHESRVDNLIALHQFLRKVFDDVRFVVICNRKNLDSLPAYVVEHMEIKDEHVTFREQLSFVSASNVIIDLVIADHAGFSFRIFEGLQLMKKVVTTNPTIRDADFYHPNNFFLFEDDNYDDLKSFLATPYVEISKDIVEQYSFTNWIKSKIN